MKLGWHSRPLEFLPARWSHERYFSVSLVHNLLYYQYIWFLQELKVQIVLNCTDCVKRILCFPALLILKMCHHSVAILLLFFRLTWSRTACFLLYYIKYQLKEQKPKATFLSKQRQFHNFFFTELMFIAKRSTSILWSIKSSDLMLSRQFSFIVIV